LHIYSTIMLQLLGDFVRPTDPLSGLRPWTSLGGLPDPLLCAVGFSNYFRPVLNSSTEKNVMLTVSMSRAYTSSVVLSIHAHN